MLIYAATTILSAVVGMTKIVVIRVPKVIVYFQELLLVSACQHASSPGPVPRGVPKNWADPDGCAPP